MYTFIPSRRPYLLASYTSNWALVRRFPRFFSFSHIEEVSKLQQLLPYMLIVVSFQLSSLNTSGTWSVKRERERERDEKKKRNQQRMIRTIVMVFRRSAR